MPKFQITTAIDYPNSLPHIGTAFEKVGADVQARFRRLQGYDVSFLMGTDENTIKVVKKAKELNKPTQEYVDEMAAKFREVWDAMGITYTDFVQTSSTRHSSRVASLILKIAERHPDAFYKKTYESLYCEGCEEFKTTSAGTICPNHINKPLILVQEENWFFKVTKFIPELTAFYEKNHTFIQPATRLNEVLAWLEQSQDISITRKNLEWGIPFPLDTDQTIYVWFDALLSYFTAADDWPPDMQFIGKDITRFHGILWPAMLLAAGLEFPKKIFAHGFIYKRAGSSLQKESKSNAPTSPLEIIAKYGNDAYRYYFLSKCSFKEDGEYNEGHFLEVYNGELANNIGNLVSRVVGMIQKYFPDGFTAKDEYHWLVLSQFWEYEKKMDNCEYSSYLQDLLSLWNAMNLYIDKTKPWVLAKDENKEPLAKVMLNLVCGLRTAAFLMVPFMPDTAKKIYSAFNFPDKWEEINWSKAKDLALNLGSDLGTIKTAEGKFPILFDRK
jgi:methionyl-tRNA synthetase